jgi:hypothetical protein
MSQITLQTLDFSSLGFPSVGEFYLGVDVDGIPKLRRSNDTIPLYATSSGYLQYFSVSYSDFLNLYNTSSLEPGSIYVINNFRTSHYIQYTDAVGDGTGLGESINFGSIEPLVVVATSNSTYDSDVKSLLHPYDEIKWIHELSDRDYDHYNNPSGVGRGHIVYRKSDAGNSRDYDFRNIVFWRWNDGSGNYTIVRRVDAPNIFDYKVFKAFEEGFVDPFLKNEIGSFTSLNNGLGIPYYLDNLVISTFSSVVSNKINLAHGTTINTPSFAENQIGIMLYSTIHDTSSQMIINKIHTLANSNVFGDFWLNDVSYIDGSTFSNEFYANKISGFTGCIVGTAQANNIIGVDNSQFQNLNNNTGNLINNSVIGTFENNNFNIVASSSITSFTYNDVNQVSNNTVGTVSGNIVNILTGNTCSQITDNISVEIKDNVMSSIYNNTIDVINENILAGDIYYNIGTQIAQNVGTISIFTNRVNQLNQNTGSASIGANSSDEIFNNVFNNSTIYSNTVKMINTNTVNNSLSYNVGHLINSNTASYIESNNVTEIENNILGTFSYNIGSEFKFNSITQSQYNSLISVTNNNINNFGYNVVGFVNTTISGTFAYNSIESSSNNQIGLVTLNRIVQLDTNTFSVLAVNDVVNIDNNIGTNFTQNISNSISQNSITNLYQNNIHTIFNNNSTNILNNDGNRLENNTVTSIVNNKVHLIDSNTGSTFSNNDALEISSNTFTILEENKVKTITNNTVTNIRDNNGNLIDNNTGITIESNQINSLYNNLVTTISQNIVNDISSNIGDSISLNNSNKIIGNTVSNIDSNQTLLIQGNEITLIQSNISEQISNNTDPDNNGGLIYDNSVMDISNNSNFNEILSNTGNQISNNSFTASIFEGATATFSWTGTPSVNDIAIINYNGLSQSVISSTSSPIGFVNQIYGLFPASIYFATYSSSVFALTTTQSFNSVNGAPFSVQIIGTNSVYANVNFSGTLNDITIYPSAYTQSFTNQYLVYVSNTGTPNKFNWQDDMGNSASNVSITGSSQSLSFGVNILFSNTTGHAFFDNWLFDVVPFQSDFSVTYSATFSGETSVSYNNIKRNNVANISSNTRGNILSNVGLRILSNDVNEITFSNIGRITNLSNFGTITRLVGYEFINSTASQGTYSIGFDKVNGVSLADILISKDVKNHTFLDRIDTGTLTASTDMQTSTYSTVSRWVWDLAGHYEEKARSTGMTYSGPIA